MKKLVVIALTGILVLGLSTANVFATETDTAIEVLESEAEVEEAEETGDISVESEEEPAEEPVQYWDADREYFDSVANEYVNAYNEAGCQWFGSTYEWGAWEERAQRAMDESMEHWNSFCDYYNQAADYYTYGTQEYAHSPVVMKREAATAIRMAKNATSYWNHVDPYATETTEITEESVEEQEETEEETYIEIKDEAPATVAEIAQPEKKIVIPVQNEITEHRDIRTWCTHGARENEFRM